ncbi:alpha/beta fold hydrolase [Solicola gregarius]|uniref:Alpha/beta fold hydrolase n=1 Tax=Solicola gregarius TaxID=2908642 RepID=A0AA46THK6_9ACTN|nr:alpha/beta fold hydrolase [Solicola gregarius]UYM05497.1 alpha/beta fold hydrolase [Solicola gregarius]UYM05530.1 alpha/beta fold hydrolase [Solicola gregarius]
MTVEEAGRSTEYALAYREYGEPAQPTMVLLHSLGTDGRMWHDCIDAFVKAHRVVVPDCRGHGLSDASPDASVEHWVNDLHGLLQKIDGYPVLLVGVSLGGIQAIAFAAMHPALVSGIVVADSFASLPRDISEAKIRTLVERATSAPMHVVADEYIADTFESPVPAGAESVRRAIAEMDAASYIAAVRACFGVDIDDELARVQAPTLVLWGDRDNKTPRPLSERLVDGISQAELQVVPDSGHLSNVDNPTAFAHFVSSFSRDRREARSEPPNSAEEV